MSIATRITSIENHLSNDYIEIARLGADLTNVDKNIENIAETIREAYSKMPKVLGTGSNLSLSPTLKGGLDITPIGACEQDSTTGKNKMPSNLSSKTMSGITMTKNADGSITLNGTATNYFEATGSGFNIGLSAGKYTFCALQSIPSGVYYTLYKAGGVGVFPLYNNHSADVQTIAEDTTMNLYEYIYINSGTTINNLTLYPMLVSGEYTLQTIGEYEQYTGGIPSPSPSFPQPIRVVTGDNTIKIQNKNLFDEENLKNVIVSGDDIIVATNGATIIEGIFKENTQYAIQAQTKQSTSGTYVRARIVYTDGTTDDILLNSSTDYVLKTSVSALNKTINKITSYGGNNFTFKKGTLQIEVGSTATEYIPHAEQKVTLHLGTNYLAGIGDYDDEIVGKTDDWKIKRYVGKVTLDNSNINIVQDYGVVQGIPRVYILRANIQMLKTYQTPVALVNNYNEQTNIANIQSGQFITKNGNLTIDFYNSDFESLTDARTKMIGTILYFVLATPTEEPVTDTTLISDLNNMYNLMGYDGQTNVTISSDNSNAQMTAQVKALKGE